jgi:hypothetical protein
MDTVPLITAIIFCAGFLTLIRALGHAPEGTETDDGFEFTRLNPPTFNRAPTNN